ncbi:class I SAM-dependent methyltransferase [Patescibacteria group bacterium]|nr:class I SAM-dependent methyltransferase [Patescibacteria group bacterium]
MKRVKKSVGTQADLASKVDITKVHSSYFSKKLNLKCFVDVGLKPINRKLPQKINYVDFGGGPGVLAGYVSEWLVGHNHQVTTSVADANPVFLYEAKKRGLKTKLCNIHSCQFANLDLITMRAVLHYNQRGEQLGILKNAVQSLRMGGWFIHQVSSGTEINCRLRSEIVNLTELSRAGTGKYHWTSIKETLELHQNAGFLSVKLAGYASPAAWSPEEQWKRFNGQKLLEAKKQNNQRIIKNIEKRKRLYLAKANGLCAVYLKKYGKRDTGVERLSNGQYRIHYQYPIFVCQK